LNANSFDRKRQLAKDSITDAEWIDFMRLVTRKSFEDDLKFLLDKYKTVSNTKKLIIKSTSVSL